MPNPVVALNFDAYQRPDARHTDAWYESTVESDLRAAGIVPETVSVTIAQVLYGHSARMVIGVLSVSADMPEEQLFGVVRLAALAAGMDPAL